MKKALLILCCLLLPGAVFALSGKAYMERFQAYMQWNQELPPIADSKFIAFIDSKTPLARKLRERWLYHLAHIKDWAGYTTHYQDSTDINLQCFALLALYHQGKQQQALTSAKALWLSGSSLPSGCNQIFDYLLTSEDFDEQLITQRIKLALENQNISLARHLLKQYNEPRLRDAQTLTDIFLNPTRIIHLDPATLHSDFYLYGLKRLVALNKVDHAMLQWQHVKTKKLLNTAQQQSFLAYIALYKSIRNHPDAQFWFSKVNPAYYDDRLLDWQIRYALKNLNWSRVEYLINHSKDKDSPAWQYWLARALAAQGKETKAREIYQTIAKSRNYYGFLASLRLHQRLSFENEYPISSMRTLEPYAPFTQQIKGLYETNQVVQASRLLNDFVLELPKDDKSALAYWLAHVLKWPVKALYLSNTDELNNQLSLRFPLAYRESVDQYARDYRISPELIFAIIRQESTFRDDVISPAGAHGLMQVMPATAQAIAKQASISYVDKKQLFLAQKNINIGTAYLQELAKRFNKHPVLMAAAYNAGPRQVVYWLKNHPPKQMDIWIETLPWHETRNYLKNVISFYAVYQYRMQLKPDLSEFMKPFNS